MTLDYNDPIVGWIPYPDTDTTAKIYQPDWDDVTVDLARYRIAYGRSSTIGPTKRVIISGGSVATDPGPVVERLTASQRPGGTIRLDWIAGAISDNVATPDNYKVYTIAKNGDETLLTTVTHNNRSLKHNFTTEALSAVLTTFEVRAQKDGAESVGIQVQALPDDTDPAAAEAPTIT